MNHDRRKWISFYYKIATSNLICKYYQHYAEDVYYCIFQFF